MPSLRDEMLTIGELYGASLVDLRAGFVEVSQARSDWAPDPAHPLPKFATTSGAAWRDVDREVVDEGTLERPASHWKMDLQGSRRNGRQQFLNKP